jgi:hypothetical protein
MKRLKEICERETGQERGKISVWEIYNKQQINRKKKCKR